MVELVWCIAQEIFEGRPGEQLADVLREHGQTVYEFIHDKEERCYFSKDHAFEDEYPMGLHPLQIENAPLIMLHGPIQFVKQMMCTRGAFITDFKVHMNCTDYMSRLPLDYFLNSDAMFTTYGMLKQRPPKDNIFIRPNSAFKTFTGFEVKVEDFELEMSSLRQIQRVDDSDIIMVSSPKEIEGEFRCVVVDGKVVAYSTYRWDDILDVRRDIFPDCLEFAEMIAAHPYQLDRAYVVDVCRTADGPKIVEFNSLCSSGLYACDLHAIVAEIEKLSVKIIEEEFV